MNRFREFRKARGLSQAQLAEIIRVDQTAVSKWELGKSFPDMEIAMRVADFFKCSVDYLLGRTDDPQTEKSPPDGELNLSDIEFAFLREVRELDEDDKAELMRDAQRMRELRELRKKQQEKE